MQMKFGRAAADLSINMRQEHLRSPAAAGVSNINPEWIQPSRSWRPQRLILEVRQELNKNVCVGFSRFP